LIKKTYSSEWPVSVDWQSPDCESQILMVLSQLPLAICFPSGLHAAELTLKLREVITRINITTEKNWKNLQFWMPYQCRSPSTRKTYVFESFTFLFCKDILISKELPFRVVLHTGHSDRNMIDLVIFQHIDWKQLTYSSARSPSTGNLQIASPKSWWSYRHCRWQFAFHLGSTPQSRPCNREKSGHESTETERETLWEKELEKKNVRVWVPGHRRLAIPRLRVPNLDGFVKTAAGNLLSIWAPRHRVDPEIVRSQDTN